MIAPASRAARRLSACPGAARPMQPRVLHPNRTIFSNASSSSASCLPYRVGVIPMRDGIACHSSSISSLRTLNDTRSEALSPSRNWFVESVPSIVTRIAGGTSSLHVVHSRSKGAPQIFHSDLAAHESPAQSWQQCSTRIRQEQADGIVLIQPISGSNLDYCPMQASSAAHLDRPSSSALSVSDSPSASPRHEGQQQQARSSLDGRSHTTSYYGVVVTTAKSGSEVCGACPLSSGGSVDGIPTGGCDGCYVLKLSKSPGLDPETPGCTHYTLTRVCQGRPLDQQLWEPWLSSQ